MLTSLRPQEQKQDTIDQGLWLVNERLEGGEHAQCVRGGGSEKDRRSKTNRYGTKLCPMCKKNKRKNDRKNDEKKLGY